ncbi:hypothetical protein [Saccharopolyspora sp. 5N708]|uniref:hypothetical protein n=1 Tax=Saccharopolyspora sp. 5N708 TaxID=3457424 RepID=UPI003FD35FA0
MFVQRLQAAALLLGPLIFATSPFFWVDGHYGVTGGMLIALAMAPWVYGRAWQRPALATTST